MPILENVMYNYSGCNQTMFGTKENYGITYKANQRSFDIYRRKFEHNFEVCLSQDNLEGAFAVSLPSNDAFLVAHGDKVVIFDANDFSILNTISIKLLAADTRETNQIIGMTISKCGKWLSVISGKNLIMDE